jgi:hypothetical protein
MEEINLKDYLNTEADPVTEAAQYLFDKGYLVMGMIHADDVINKLGVGPICLGCLNEASENIKDKVLDILVAELERMKEEGNAC